MSALMLGTLIAVAALAYVLYPLFFGAARAVAVPLRPADEEPDLAVAALREIEFDRATGKLSDADYTALRERYTAEALTAMRRDAARATTAVSEDPVEAAVRAYRATHGACATCGPRPEADATYCSNCGAYLPGACAGCGATVRVPGSRHCSDCGRRLAA